MAFGVRPLKESREGRAGFLALFDFCLCHMKLGLDLAADECIIIDDNMKAWCKSDIKSQAHIFHIPPFVTKGKGTRATPTLGKQREGVSNITYFKNK